MCTLKTLTIHYNACFFFRFFHCCNRIRISRSNARRPSEISQCKIVFQPHTEMLKFIHIDNEILCRIGRLLVRFRRSLEHKLHKSYFFLKTSTILHLRLLFVSNLCRLPMFFFLFVGNWHSAMCFDIRQLTGTITEYNQMKQHWINKMQCTK